MTINKGPFFCFIESVVGTIMINVLLVEYVGLCWFTDMFRMYSA